MPYRATTDPVLEQRGVLDRIVQEPHVSFPADNPSALRYRIHEALHAARVLGIEPYCRLRVTVRTVKDAVVVTWNVPFTAFEPARYTMAMIPEITTFQGRNEYEVIEAVMGHPDISWFEFTHFAGDLESIQAWVEARADLQITSTTPLTIVRR